MTTRAFPLFCCLALPLHGCGGGGTAPCDIPTVIAPGSQFFTDISEESGIQAGNYDPDPVEGTSINDHSRLAFADLNGDAFDDIVMHSLYPNALNGVPFEHLVFLNNGDGTFTDHSDASGLREIQAGFFAFADMDNDGDQDVFAGLDIHNEIEGSHEVWLNDGQGVFTQVENPGVDSVSYTVAANAVFADFNGDAVVDLFIGNGGTSYAVYDYLYKGNGDGTFTSWNSRLEDSAYQPSNGSVTCDYDDDGDLDIFVSTYSVSTVLGHNALWENDGSGHFEDVAVERGFAALATGNYWLSATDYGATEEPSTDTDSYVGSNGFGIDCADVNGDGYMDVFLSAISHPNSSDYGRTWSDPSQLLINQGPDGDYAFVNEFLERGLPFNEGDVDAATVDFDNDGRLDLSLSRDSKYESSYSSGDQKSWFGLMHQLEDGTFDSIGTESGINDIDNAEWDRMKGAQNHAWADIDRDGDLDLLVGGRDQGGGRPNFLFRNDMGSENRWLTLDLVGDGDAVNRDAIGTQVRLITESRTLLREKKSSRGMYNSEDTRSLHFGLGDLACSYEVQVRWPDGETATFSSEALFERGHFKVSYPDQIEAR